ncbi:MAG: hypothetical protein K9M84_07515 [Spirochaetia bacterium]|nr:hypothetical protein [Spirochaetia bacterium]
MLVAQESLQPDVSLYIEGLESLAEQQTAPAESSFMQLVDRYPRSPFAPKASAYLEDLHSRVDNSGIVPFYLGNLATATYTAAMLPILFELDQSTVTYGLSGLGGVALGLAGSAAMASDYPVTSGLSWAITTSQLVSLGNYLYLNGIIDLGQLVGQDAEMKVFLGGQLLTLNGSLLGSYFSLRDQDVSEGKASFALHSYAWANAYYWMAVAIAQSSDLKRTSTIGLAVTDGALAGSLSLWDSLRWTPMRTGLVTVGGLGGALLGWFGTMVVGETLDLGVSEVFTAVMSSAVAGQAAAVYLTSRIPPEAEQLQASDEAAADVPISLALLPVPSGDSLPGMQLRVGLSF